jgi:hypothetical protein
MNEETIKIIKGLDKNTLINYINDFLKIIQSNQKMNDEDKETLKELNKELMGKY